VRWIEIRLAGEKNGSEQILRNLRKKVVFGGAFVFVGRSFISSSKEKTSRQAFAIIEELLKKTSGWWERKRSISLPGRKKGKEERNYLFGRVSGAS